MTAQKKLMDYLANRAHSEYELREKLHRNFTEDEVNAAIAHAKVHEWIAKPEDLAAEVAAQLSRKGKGTEYINTYLAEKGLPCVCIDAHDEFQKALKLIEKHLKLKPPFKAKDQANVCRLLKNRGFQYDIIQKFVPDPL